MITFVWHCDTGAYRGKVRWILWNESRTKFIGQCYYLPGSKKFYCSASALVEGGVVLCDYYAGTATAARKALEHDWDKRSIGLFGEDDIEFRVAA